MIEALSSSWLGHGPLKAGARVRVPLGLVNNFNSGVDFSSWVGDDLTFSDEDQVAFQKQSQPKTLDSSGN
jgi:hypothetical protein